MKSSWERSAVPRQLSGKAEFELLQIEFSSFYPLHLLFPVSGKPSRDRKHFGFAMNNSGLPRRGTHGPFKGSQIMVKERVKRVGRGDQGVHREGDKAKGEDRETHRAYDGGRVEGEESGKGEERNTRYFQGRQAVKVEMPKPVGRRVAHCPVRANRQYHNEG